MAARSRSYDTPYGKLGGLICWENYMPLARYAMYAWGVQIYVAPTWDSSDDWVGTMQHIAREGRVRRHRLLHRDATDEIPDALRVHETLPAGQEARGRVGERGQQCDRGAGRKDPCRAGRCEEKIIYAEIDPAWARGSKFSLDVAGHYARPDVFQLTVNRDPNEMINVAGHSAGNNGKVTTSRAKARRKA